MIADILHCIYVIFFRELQSGLSASGTKIKVTVNRLRNMRSCKTYFCSSGTAEKAQTRSVCFQKCIISHFHQYAAGGEGGLKTALRKRSNLREYIRQDYITSTRICITNDHTSDNTASANFLTPKPSYIKTRSHIS